MKPFPLELRAPALPEDPSLQPSKDSPALPVSHFWGPSRIQNSFLGSGCWGCLGDSQESPPPTRKGDARRPRGLWERSGQSSSSRGALAWATLSLGIQVTGRARQRPHHQESSP